jgi:hypothetical protein
LEIQVYFYLEHDWGLQGTMSTLGSHTTSKSHRLRPILCHVEHGGGTPAGHIRPLHSREGVSVRSTSAVFRRRERGGL